MLMAVPVTVSTSMGAPQLSVVAGCAALTDPEISSEAAARTSHVATLRPPDDPRIMAKCCIARASLHLESRRRHLVPGDGQAEPRVPGERRGRAVVVDRHDRRARSAQVVAMEPRKVGLWSGRRLEAVDLGFIGASYFEPAGLSEHQKACWLVIGFQLDHVVLVASKQICGLNAEQRPSDRCHCNW